MHQNVHRLITGILMWLVWLSLLFGIATIITFAYVPKPEANKWIFEFPWVVTLALLLTIPLSVRFLVIPRLKNPWLIYLIFMIGVIFGHGIAVIGMFALQNGQNTYILSGVVSILLFCPHWLMNSKIATCGVNEQKQEG